MRTSALLIILAMAMGVFACGPGQISTAGSDESDLRNKRHHYKDTDKDGVLDINDQCPNEAGPAENNGCPWPDSDGDGVTDNVDACPNEPGPAENNGCPVDSTGVPTGGSSGGTTGGSTGVSTGGSTGNSTYTCTTSAEAKKMADFILGLEDAAGAIPDGPGGDICDEDSTMEYALIGLAHAYACFKDPRYLDGLERGIAWLAAREEMTDATWKGSWWYGFSSKSPYNHVAISPGSGVQDVRGVDATSSLFVYLLYLDQAITGSSTLVNTYASNARAALDFILAKNWSPDGFSYSSWQLSTSGSWNLWKYEYSADQMDVYLGIRAGAAIYDGPDRRYGNAADHLRSAVPKTFFMTGEQRFAMGGEDGSLDSEFDGFDGIFPQGYLPWILGNTANGETLAAYQWLKNGLQSDGSLILVSGDPKYSLSIAVYALAAVSLGQPRPDKSIQWLLANAYDPTTGGVHDTDDPSSDLYTNVAAFTLMALLGMSPI